MEYSEEERRIIVLDSFKGLSYKVKRELLHNFQTNQFNIANLSNIMIEKEQFGVYNEVEANFYDEGYRTRLFEFYQKEGIFCVTYFSKDYPQSLKAIPLPPLVLYGKGNRQFLKERMFCVVGSRHVMPAAVKQTERIAEALCEKYAVVTGIADGSDSAALEGALKGGRAICVLPGGFRHVHPATSVALEKRVEEEGLVLTEHIPDVSPLRWMFPVRNRILAGLGEGTLVTSAGAESGALLTAGYAREYGRPVFAFPYGIEEQTGVGCNALLKNGAFLTENILDIGTKMGLNFKRTKKVVLVNAEKDIYDFLKDNGPSHVNAITQALHCQTYELVAILSSLEVKCMVVHQTGNIWRIV
jgi:DNA processing protein